MNLPFGSGAAIAERAVDVVIFRRARFTLADTVFDHPVAAAEILLTPTVMGATDLGTVRGGGLEDFAATKFNPA
ncbi:hypothetical protein [Glutamicibacter sp. NPDC087344]|uniref:hypothetical protein n=1 Tax=Glutamicibacter sp. NPDC087344 TaxID=3363994 RepID=UPI003800B290